MQVGGDLGPLLGADPGGPLSADRAGEHEQPGQQDRTDERKHPGGEEGDHHHGDGVPVGAGAPLAVEDRGRDHSRRGEHCGNRDDPAEGPARIGLPLQAARDQQHPWPDGQPDHEQQHGDGDRQRGHGRVLDDHEHEDPEAGQAEAPERDQPAHRQAHHPSLGSPPRLLGRDRT
jgi:hypothetical protein